ncbi:MAG: TIGR02281 family clan AA aspartic protease [Pseudomonadota bacterium]
MGQYAGLYALVTLAALLAVLGMRSFNEEGEFTPGLSSRIGPPAVVRADNGETELLIKNSLGGSFLTKATFDGAQAEVLVDTGASYTTLRESDALRAGINPRSTEYRHRFSTANGEVFAARAQVSDLGLGPAYLTNVTVFVLPDDKLEISLLGMNVLRRFDRMEMTAEGLRLSVQ